MNPSLGFELLILFGLLSSFAAGAILVYIAKLGAPRETQP